VGSSIRYLFLITINYPIVIVFLAVKEAEEILFNISLGIEELIFINLKI